MKASELRKKLLPILWEQGDLRAVGKPAGIDVGGDVSKKSNYGVIELLAQFEKDDTR